MRAILTIAVLFVVAANVFAAEPFAPAGHVPALAKSAVDATLYPIPQQQVAAYLGHLTQAQTFWNFRGQNEALQAKNIDLTKMPTIGQGLTVDLGPEALFQAPFEQDGYQVFLGAVTSVDAENIRLQVDLGAMADDEELWLIDPVGQRPFGPYSRADQVADGRWLPTVEGDTAVLMVRSLRADLPQVRVLTLSHFFWNLEELKELSCNINLACEADETIQEVSSGVGLMVVPYTSGDEGLCSGTLINNPGTAGYEPYYLTANHCVPGVANASQVDIIWDFRKASCGSATAPALSTLPRSSGETVLATSGILDCTLMELDTVPVGTYGRTYLGWDATRPAVGDECVVLHFPDAAYMRISYANITRLGISEPSLGYILQNEVQYPVGVTEGGSSGSCLLSAKLDYAIIGTLSNGTTHTCDADRSGNTDNFSSFRRFYYSTAAQSYLDGTSSGNPECPSVVSLEDNKEALASLRTVRDRALSTSPAGQVAVRAYYLAAPTLADFARRSTEFKQTFAAVAGTAARIADYLMR